MTTNKHLAQKAGITTGALYHYFESKTALYQAVYGEVQDQVYAVFAAAVAAAETFVAQFEAVLEAAHELNRADPSLARFVGAARIDMARSDELRVVLTPEMTMRAGFVARMVDNGVVTGEIRPDDRATVRVLVRMLFVGLTDAVSSDPRQHRLAVDGIRALLEGRLVTSPGLPA
jgi:AcrR family transcriptional regulator